MIKKICQKEGKRVFLFSWCRPQCRLKATFNYNFSSSSVHSSDVYCQLPGRCSSFSFFLTYFLSMGSKAVICWRTVNTTWLVSKIKDNTKEFPQYSKIHRNGQKVTQNLRSLPQQERSSGQIHIQGTIVYKTI